MVRGNYGQVSGKMHELLDLIGRAFEAEADDALLDSVRAYVDAPVTGLLADAQKHAERGMHQLDSALTAYAKAEDGPLWRDYLDASYAELFLGVTPKASEPVESCYMNDERILYAQQYFEVKALMDEHGFSAPAEFREPLDHIAMEWRFFSFLLREGKGDIAWRFKVDHMDTWMERACAAIVDRDDVGFYTGIANLARAVLAEFSSSR